MYPPLCIDTFAPAGRRAGGQRHALGRDPEVVRHELHPRSLKGFQRVVDGDLPAPEVAQREPVARGLGARPPTPHLAEVPVQPLVAVDKAEHLAPRPEPDLLSHPGKSHPGAALAPCVEVDKLVERPERLGYADDDAANVELTEA